MKRVNFLFVLIGACFALVAPQVFAQDVPARAATVDKIQGGGLGDDAKVAIAKQLANPIASLVSVPFQYNYSRGVGKNQAGSEQTLLFQPVVPFDLGGGDAFILRPIVTNAREVNVNGFSAYGVANVTIESFYAPNTGSSWIWGVGPYAISPSGNSGNFGSQQTGAGVTGVVLNRHGPWTYGLLAYQSWSVGGNPTFGTQNNLYGQPFVAYTTKDAWTFTLQSQAQYNYDAHRTTNPVYLGISKLEVFDKLPVQFGVGPTYYLSNTPGGPSGWGGRATITFVFPK
jgi:hypothetical protein